MNSLTSGGSNWPDGKNAVIFIIDSRLQSRFLQQFPFAISEGKLWKLLEDVVDLSWRSLFVRSEMGIEVNKYRDNKIEEERTVWVK